MTSQTEETAGTAIEQVAPGSSALEMINGDKEWTLADLLDTLAGPAEAEADEPEAKPAPRVKLTDALKARLKQLPLVFGQVMPTETRKLEADELKRLTEEQQVIAALTTELGKREKAIDTLVRHHMDAVAREQGKEGAVIPSGVAKGHMLLASKGEPFEVPVEGFDEAWQQRRVKGSADLSPVLLGSMKAAGTVTQSEYLAMTAAVRVIDTDKIKAFTRRQPVRAMEILKAITVRKPDTASLYAPKK